MNLEINSTDSEFDKQKKERDDNIGKIVNREDAEKANYFWGIVEAKALEGSAVPMASNPFTPTQQVKQEVKPDVVKSAIDIFLGT